MSEATTLRASTPVSAASRLVVVVPVFNEGSSVSAVLDQIRHACPGRILIVDDGSTDGSPVTLDAWARKDGAAEVIHLVPNQGKSAALRAAWRRLADDLAAGALDPETLVVNLDADGQHDLAYLDGLIARLETTGADAIIARRDFSYHGWYKRAGNVFMSAVGSLFAGRRMHDIESGYRIVRLGPLLHAQEFYRGRRYSECTEFAVVAQRLGYLVDNEFPVRVPVARTNTRLQDAVSHVLLMALAWLRVVCWRDVPKASRSWLGIALALVILGSFGGFLATVLSHAFYLGNDSAQSYGHVWFIEQALRSGEGIPLHVPLLDGGRAVTFPYAAIPWLPAAFARPFLGDWAVTATMGLGVLLLLYGVAKWLPRTATPLVLAVLLLNWQLWNAILQFQLPTIWALALSVLSAAQFDRGRPTVGGLLAFAALVAHPLMGGVGLALTVLAHIEATRRLPVPRVLWLLGAAVLASPAIWVFFQLPSIDHVGRWGWVTPMQITLQRTSLLWWPWACQRAIPFVRRWHVPVLIVGGVLLAWNFAGSNPQNARWTSLPRFPDFIAAGRIDPQSRYRVLTMSNQEDGMVQLMQAGAVLAQDFFDESVERRSFSGTEEYRCFLARKGATDVLVQAQWLRHPLRDTSNEVEVLDALVAEGRADLVFRGDAGTLQYTIRPVAFESCGSRP